MAAIFIGNPNFSVINQKLYTIIITVSQTKHKLFNIAPFILVQVSYLSTLDAYPCFL